MENLNYTQKELLEHNEALLQNMVEYDDVFFELDDELDILKSMMLEIQKYCKASDEKNLEYSINAGIRQLYKLKKIVANQLEMFID